MKRTLLGVMILASVSLGLAVPYVAGREKDKKKGNDLEKLDVRPKKAEAIPVPSPGIHTEVVDQGHYILVPSTSTGYYGECYPTLTPVWVPCLVNVPVGPKFLPQIEEQKMEKLGPPMKQAEPTSDGPVLPDHSSVPVSVTRTVSGGGQPRVVTVRQVVPIYYTRGLGVVDAPQIYGSGLQLFYAGKPAEALARFDAAIRLDAKDARTWYYKSLCETALGEKAAATKSIDRAVELHLQGKPAAAQIGQALERIQGAPRLQFREALDARGAK